MRKNLIILALFVVFLFSGCQAKQEGGKQEQEIVKQEEVQETAEYRKITAAQANEKMTETEGWILLDVRTIEEFEEERIDGAILIPDNEISSRVEIEIPDKDAVVLIYCRSGRRSAIAAEEMVDLGYTGVYDFGGIIDWPYETISG